MFKQRRENARKKEKTQKKPYSKRPSILQRLSRSALLVMDDHKDFSPYGIDKEVLQNLDGLKWIRQFLYFILHDENFSSASLYVLGAILALIVISTLFYVLETVSSLSKTKGQRLFWHYAELTVTILFSVEFVGRLIVVKNKWKYVIRPMNVVDLLAVVPYYIEQLFPQIPGTSLRVLRVVRLARLGRLRNIFSEYIDVLTKAIRNAADEAGPMMFLMVMVEVILFGASVYAFENGFHSDGSFDSIPDTMWWAFVTITTVGYGDLVPITVMGRILGIFCMFSGIVLMSICVIIIGGNFEQVHQAIATEKFLKSNQEKDNGKNSSSSEKDYRSLKLQSTAGIPGIKIGININRRTGKRNLQNLEVLKLENRTNRLETRCNDFLGTDEKTTSLFEKRGYKLPWLREKKYLDWLSEYEFLSIIEYLNDDDLFQVRSLNQRFYGTYYGQKVEDIHCSFNFHRAFKLASLERAFPFVKCLRLHPKELRGGRISFVNTETFPKLDTFWAVSGQSPRWHRFEDFRKLSHASLKWIKLEVDGRSAQGNKILDGLPRLRRVEITCQSQAVLALPASHLTLEELSVVNCTLDISRDITRERFPELKLLRGNLSPDAQRMLTSIGVLVKKNHDEEKFDLFAGTDD